MSERAIEVARGVQTKFKVRITAQEIGELLSTMNPEQLDTCMCAYSGAFYCKTLASWKVNKYIIEHKLQDAFYPGSDIDVKTEALPLGWKNKGEVEND